MRNTEPLFCPACPWTTPPFRRNHHGVGVSNLGRLREHVAVAHPSEPALDAPWEPRTFAIGDLVTMTKQPECLGCESYDFTTRGGVVIGVDRSIDAPDDLSPDRWEGDGPDPMLALRGHYYLVLLDQPIRDKGAMTLLMRALRGRDWWHTEILAAASELEAQ